MLLRFTFANFRSFRAESELSMIAGPFSDLPHAVLKRPATKEGVLPVAAIYGANASGKTNVLKALEFMKSAVENSHRGWRPEGPIPREAFRLEEKSRKAPSMFAADTVVSGIRYQYGFSIDDKTVQKEWLNAYPNGRKQAWYSRQAGRPIEFSSKLSGENRTIEALTRPNSLSLSAAAQNNHEMLTPIYRWFVDAFTFITSDKSTCRQVTVALGENEAERKKIAHLLQMADLGIADLQVKRADISLKQLGIESSIELLHKAKKEPIAFSLSQESEGTAAYLSMLGPLLATLKMGGVLCVDELDASLHPLLAMQIINLFNDPALNSNGAQLIFNTHDSNLLSLKILRRDQIWFTEKQPDGSSQLYPLTDFKPRLGENIESGYLQGRYGAIPFLNSESLAVALDSGNGKNR
jgi:AAA15 family ATPase/GTPase